MAKRPTISERRVSTLAELVRWAGQRVATHGQNFWYRGTRRGHSLVPGVFRLNMSLETEQNLVTAFKLQAPALRPDCPVQSDTGAWLSLMQHYRLPTRLLDWTRSPLVAAYFAVENERSRRDAVIWELEPFQMNGALHGTPIIHAITEGPVAPLRDPPFDEEIVSAGPPPPPRATSPVSIDQRFFVQQSEFTIHGDGRHIDRVKGASRWLRRLVIPRARCESIREDLAAVGVSRSTLFPDLDNLAEDLQTQFVE